MAIHISLRLAWHNEGWNGHICKNPEANTFCVGPYSYPGDLISHNRDTEWESGQDVRGYHCSRIEQIPPCCYSINAFGKQEIKANASPPDWFNDDSEAIEYTLPPATACVWPYETMYTDDVKMPKGSKQTYDYDKRLTKSEEYFKQLEPGKSLVFYYANYSNPFSEDIKQYVLVGISRLKNLGKTMYYQNVSDENKKKYTGGFVWQKNITSFYPDQGFQIPYSKYKTNPEILKRLLIVPENPRNFKYATRHIADDDAINIIEQFLAAVRTLIELKDTMENWTIRLEWLQGLLAELWKNRGLYPCMPKILDFLQLHSLIEYYKHETLNNDEQTAYDNIKKYISTGKTDDQQLQGYVQDLNSTNIKREWALKEDDEKKLLLDILPRFDLTDIQITNILSENRTENGITASLSDIYTNPYLISEQYRGDHNDDHVPFYKIDNGVLPSPELGFTTLFEANSSERLKGICVDILRKESVHTFLPATIILNRINTKLSYLPEWKQSVFKMKYFDVEKEFLEKSLVIQNDENEKYLYLNYIHKDERHIAHCINDMLNRPDITIKIPITVEYFQTLLLDRESKLYNEIRKEYLQAITEQATLCSKLFFKPCSVISGRAGTGKTTIIKAILKASKKVDEEGASFMLLSPTGKASDRLREKTGCNASTIHSFLTIKGWINKNYTIKRAGGMIEQDIKTIIIDECSMLDLELFTALFRAINWNYVKRLVLVGDPHQLPPIGRGKVFHELVSYLKKNFQENIVELKINVRQMESRITGKGNNILELANIFINDEFGYKQDKFNTEIMLKKIQAGGDIDNDLKINYWKTQNDLEASFLNVLRQDLISISGEEESEELSELWQAACRSEQPYIKNTNIFQILSPFRGEFYGFDNFNFIMQTNVNPFWSSRGGIDGISLFDKVIQIRNRTKSDPIYAYNNDTKENERIDIYNGELGFVIPHGFDGKKFKWSRFALKRFQVVFARKGSCRVGYGRELGKNNKDKWIKTQPPEENLELGYAISVHKSQGSEFDHVYLILPNKSSPILSSEFIYTAVTRAKVHLTLFIQDNIATIHKLTRPEYFKINQINSSVFSFNPVPNRILMAFNWYEDTKNIATLTEYYVRSKSEMNIANILHLKKIPFKYEEPLFAPDGTMFLPDFTITFKGKEYYWEHVGRLDLPHYKKHWEQKQTRYDKFFPEKLIITYESNDQSKQIEKIMNKKFTQ